MARFHSDLSLIAVNAGIRLILLSPQRCTAVSCQILSPAGSSLYSFQQPLLLCGFLCHYTTYHVKGREIDTEDRNIKILALST